ncbi:hypothetical protein Hanom_Chr07g00679121 [Helianthus anomalus]
MVAGMFPVKELLRRSSVLSMDNEPIPSGILPTRLFLPMVRSWRLEQFVMVAGMFPVKELLQRSSVFSIDNEPIPSGILPTRLLLHN